MTLRLRATSALAVAAFALLITATVSNKASRVQASSDHPDDESRIATGYAIAPVPLNLKGKNHALVGLGSYIVNAVADCDGCHSAGPQTEYLRGGNPYMSQPEQINTATYLAGGRDFGPFPAAGPFPHIISRNLTPDKTGMAEGGHTLQEFMQIMRTGVDMDNLHPTCTGAPNGNCIPAPFNGSLLQVMPWPVHRNMTDRDLKAIYEYLSSIPCNPGPPAPSVLHNDCE